MRRRWWQFAAAAIVCGAVGAAMPGAGFGQQPAGGDASMALFGAPGSILLPGFALTNFSVTVNQSANRSLVSWTPNLRMIPDLAQTWSISPDGRTYTFTLRPGLRWGDGAPITSQDVQYTVLVLSSSQTTSPWFNQVGEIVGTQARKNGQNDSTLGFKIVDDRVFHVTTEQPSAVFLDLFGTQMMPIPRHALQTIPLTELQRSDFARVPTVSSGPFAITGYQTDALVSLARNPYYYARRPALDHVFLKVLLPETAIAQLERGELQVIPAELSGELPPSEVTRLRRNPDIAVTSYPNTSTEVVYVNLKRKPLDDVRIRQAMMYALDREAIVSNALLGMGKVAYSVFASFTPWYDKALNPYKFDLAHAKQLLQEARYDAGPPLHFVSLSGDTTVTNVSTIVTQMLRTAGFNVVVEQVDAATSVTRMARAHDFDLGIGLNRGFNDPDLTRRFGAAGIATGVNYGQYTNPALEQALDQLRHTVAVKDQLPIAYKVQEFINADVPVLLLYYRDSIGAVNIRQLGGAVPRFGGVHEDMANWYRKR